MTEHNLSSPRSTDHPDHAASPPAGAPAVETAASAAVPAEAGPAVDHAAPAVPQDGEALPAEPVPTETPAPEAAPATEAAAGVSHAAEHPAEPEATSSKAEEAEPAAAAVAETAVIAAAGTEAAPPANPPAAAPEPAAPAPAPAMPAPEPTPPPAPPPPPPQPAKSGGGGTPVWLTLVIVLLFGGGLYWIYTHPAAVPGEARPEASAGSDAALKALQQRLTTLEQRPAMSAATASVDLTPLDARLAAVETTLRNEASHPGTPADTAGLAGRITALEQRPAPGTPDLAAALAPLASRLETVETTLRSATPGAAAGTAELATRLTAAEAKLQATASQGADASAKLAARLDAADAKLQSVATQDSGATAALAKLATRMDALEARLQALATQDAARAAAAARLRAAASALAAGQKLGDLPGAPPALTRFAQAAPPTEASLKLAFTPAAVAAEAASQPSTEGLGTFARMWQRVSSMVTIRQGDTVLIGPPAAVVLNRARVLLEAGDLAGSLAALAPLDAKAAAAIAPWKANVQALLDARTALAALDAKAVEVRP